MTNILVTGATGFIGSHLCRHYVHSNYEVFGITNSGYFERISDLQKFSNFHLIQTDLVKNSIELLPQKIDAVFHTAAILPNRESSRIDYYKNIIMTQNLLEYSLKNYVKIFILSSTASIYGIVNGVIDEQSSINPLSDYALSKYFCELLVELYSKKSKMKAIALRYSIVYGKGDNNSIVADYLYKFVNNIDICVNEAIIDKNRNLLHINDVVFLHDTIIKNMEKINSYNLFLAGCKESIKIIDLLDLLKKLINSKSKIIAVNQNLSETSDVHFNISKLENAFAFNPLSIKEGLSKLIKDI